jgi:tetratricopeptide (TPR) repeat protein
MKVNLRKTGNLAGIMVAAAIFSTNLNGQDRNEVIKFYNEGATAMQTDAKAAIAAFENVVTLSDKVGETAADLKQKAVQVLPGLYVKLASAAVSEKKPATEIVKAAKTAVKAAEKYQSATGKDNASKVLVQGYYAMVTEFFAKKDYNNAIIAFDSLLAINPAYASAIYNKALIYRNQNNAEAYEQTIDSFIEKQTKLISNL